eukprot:gb/GEZN01008428.1/.p1 GENE.gb/GEZN01008428.1/~~gb/GEZN01008428.1/.p1  ORF type:complete len:431 (+),score=32.40 gb/GEZN01008428.1/:41-1333(+)
MARQVVVICVSESANASCASRRCIDWILADPMGLINEPAQDEKPPKLVFLHVSSGMTMTTPLLDYVDEVSQERVKAGKVEVAANVVSKDKFGIGHTIKVFCSENKPSLLVAGLTRSELPMYLGRCDNFCPVLLVPAMVSMGEVKFESTLQVSESPIMRETKLTVKTKSHRVFLSVDNNSQSDKALSWIRNLSSLRRRSSLFLVHGVTEEHQRQSGRAFLDSYSAVTEGDNEAVLGALVDTKGQPLWMCLSIFAKATPAGGCILQVIAPNAMKEFNKIRIGGLFTINIINHFSTHPVLVYKDATTADELRQATWSFKLRRGMPSPPRSQSQARLFSPRMRPSSLRQSLSAAAGETAAAATARDSVEAKKENLQPMTASSPPRKASADYADILDKENEQETDKLLRGGSSPRMRASLSFWNTNSRWKSIGGA